LEQAAVELLWASPRTSPDPAPEGNRISDGAPERTSPQVMSDVICLLAETGRSRAYLDAMACHRLVPAAAILVKAPSAVSSPVEPRPSERFDNTTPVDAVLARMGIPTTVIEAESINDASVTEALRQFHQPYVIFSGPSGAVLGPSFFGQGKHYLHVHPGQLPQYRGSTPMYYSLLKEQRLVATALFLEQAIDTGEVLMSRSFAIPEDPMAIDQDYDPWMRAQTLVAVLEEYLREGRFHTTPQPQDQAETFFVIHPVLKHIAILQAQGNRIPHPEVLR
jgi:methionyl-tRNA formyltransferase